MLELVRAGERSEHSDKLATTNFTSPIVGGELKMTRIKIKLTITIILTLVIGMVVGPWVMECPDPFGRGFRAGFILVVAISMCLGFIPDKKKGGKRAE